MLRLERFQTKVEMIPGFECHIWTGAITKNGYGKFSDKGTNWILAHREAFKQRYGEIPKGLYACHKCDNRLCVNPDHLFLGSAKDNAIDRDKKNRRTPLKGEAHGRSKLTKEQVVEIRKLHNDGVSAWSLGKTYGVHHTTIRDIVKRNNWSHL
jgi:hypothetical protein